MLRVLGGWLEVDRVGWQHLIESWLTVALFGVRVHEQFVLYLYHHHHHLHLGYFFSDILLSRSQRKETKEMGQGSILFLFFSLSLSSEWNKSQV